MPRLMLGAGCGLLWHIIASTYFHRRHWNIIALCVTACGKLTCEPSISLSCLSLHVDRMGDFYLEQSPRQVLEFSLIVLVAIRAKVVSLAFFVCGQSDHVLGVVFGVN